ncbi:MAG: AraC family transcriptional regulator [Verrucomicrobiota bacterium]
MPPTVTADQLFVKVFVAKRETIDRDWNYRDVYSGFWRLYLNDRDGAALALTDGSRYPLPAGRIHFVPAWVRFSCLNTRPVGNLYIHFDLIGVTGVTVQRLFHKPLTLAPDRHLLATADRLVENTPTTLLQAKALVYAALAQLRFAPLPAARHPVAAAQEHIEQHLGTLITNAELARLCHFSEDHFVRLFRRHLGQTPAQYILERRIATAINQLAFTADSIEQIAAHLGFANRYHFTKMFTRRMGNSPAAYRKQARV